MKLDENLVLGDMIHVDNVTVWPAYLATPPALAREYATLQEYQAAALVEVRETGARSGGGTPGATHVGEVSGQVNRLVVENKGDQAILVLAGTLLRGGKQDRMVAQDFIVQPHTTAPVDAFCVEHGRWQASRAGRQTGGHFEVAACEATFHTRTAAKYGRGQQEVWDRVANETRQGGAGSATGTLMSLIDDSAADGEKRRKTIRSILLDALRTLSLKNNPPCGFAYAVAGKVRELRVFQNPLIFQRHIEALVNTVAIEGDLSQREALRSGRKPDLSPGDSQKVLELYKTVETQKPEVRRTETGTANAYLRGPHYSGSKTYESEADAAAAAIPVTQSWQANA
jgi:hypothetical protein